MTVKYKVILNFKYIIARLDVVCKQNHCSLRTHGEHFTDEATPYKRCRKIPFTSLLLQVKLTPHLF